MEIHDLEIKAKKNIADDHSRIALSEGELEGLSKSKLKSLKKNKQGLLEIKLTQNEYATLMSQIKKPETREKLSFAKGNLLKDKNIPVLEKLVQKRYQESVLLGYDSYSEKVLEDHMAKNPSVVQDFENDLISKI